MCCEQLCDWQWLSLAVALGTGGEHDMAGRAVGRFGKWDGARAQQSVGHGKHGTLSRQSIEKYRAGSRQTRWATPDT